jgi:signal transduction histidine kinase
MCQVAITGIVVVTARAEEKMVAIQVRDTGEGISPEELSRIWERFYQVEQQGPLQEGGAGLGLALVKEWIEVMGGSVAVESVVGQGSCFTLRLLCAGPESAE